MYNIDETGNKVSFSGLFGATIPLGLQDSKMDELTFYISV